MVSKAAERSKRQRQEIFCEPIALNRECKRELLQWNGVYSRQTDEN